LDRKDERVLSNFVRPPIKDGREAAALNRGSRIIYLMDLKAQDISVLVNDGWMAIYGRLIEHAEFEISSSTEHHCDDEEDPEADGSEP